MGWWAGSYICIALFTVRYLKSSLDICTRIKIQFNKHGW